MSDLDELTYQPRRTGRSSWWLLAIVPLVALLVGAAVLGARSTLFGGQDARTELASAGIDPVPPTGTAPTGGPSSTRSSTSSKSSPGTATHVRTLALGTVGGVVVFKGPGSAPAGARVAFALDGPIDARHLVRAAPFRWRVDTARIPNGSYRLTISVLEPGKVTVLGVRTLTVKNVKATPTTTKPQHVVPSHGPHPAPTATATVPVSTGGTQAAQVLALTNSERSKAGCKALTVSSKLTTAAQGHSADMAKNNYFSHDSQNGDSPFDRMKAAGYSFSSAGENIAEGQPDAAAVMDAWMNSPGHKANILNCGYTNIGIGYALRGSTPYWTQDFGTPL